MKLYPITSVVPLENDQYYHHVLETITKSKSRIWATLFSINLMYGNDDALRARTLVDALVDAKNRGVDVRLIIGAGQNNRTGFDASNQISTLYLEKSGIPFKFYEDDRKKSSHSKYLILDKDRIILGSHNWGHRSLRIGNDDSIEIHSEGYNKYQEIVFTNLWNK